MIVVKPRFVLSSSHQVAGVCSAVSILVACVVEQVHCSVLPYVEFPNAESFTFRYAKSV